MKRNYVCPLASLACCALAQGQDNQSMPPMPGMNHAQMHQAVMSPAETLLMRQVSGTSMGPESWQPPMVMKTIGSWRLMFMAQGFILDTQQSGLRGHDKFWSTNWGMINAEHRLGRGAVSFEFMPSLEPLTITGRYYPELFQTGETAYGKPIVDGQHPHNFVMSLAVHYATPVTENLLFEAYAAPVGDPALGPVAYPHRASASELPQAPLGHHWQDSTHISYDVVTVGLMRRWVLLEASGFHGAEPDENRWTIGYGPIDSWSTRLSVFPAKNWSAQVSVGRLAHPEAEEPGDVVRATASLSYSKPLNRASWSSSLIWGRNHNTANSHNLNSYLAESELPVTRRNFLTGRAELVDKDELFGPNGTPYRIGAATLGYTRDFDLVPNLESGIGFNVTAYRVPSAIQPEYGARPLAVNVYLRLRLRN